MDCALSELRLGCRAPHARPAEPPCLVRAFGLGRRDPLGRPLRRACVAALVDHARPLLAGHERDVGRPGGSPCLERPAASKHPLTRRACRQPTWGRSPDSLFGSPSPRRSAVRGRAGQRGSTHVVGRERQSGAGPRTGFATCPTCRDHVAPGLGARSLRHRGARFCIDTSHGTLAAIATTLHSPLAGSSWGHGDADRRVMRRARGCVVRRRVRTRSTIEHESVVGYACRAFAASVDTFDR